VAEGLAVADVLRMPPRADYCVVYRPETRTVISRDYLNEKDEKAYQGGRWATWWRVNSSVEFLRQLTALRLGSTSDPGTELEFVIMVIAVSCVKLLSAHNSTQHTSRKHKV
jgi:hypothetical protein